MNTLSLQIDSTAGSSMPLVMELPAALRRLLAHASGTGWVASAVGPEPAPDSAVRAGADATDWWDVQSSLGGDDDAYARLVARYQQKIAAYMWRFTRDRGRWEELVHDVFVEAYLSLTSYRGTGPLLHWLKRIGTRVGYGHWKHSRQQRERLVPLSESVTATLSADDNCQAARDAARLVHELLARLGPRDRLVMTLKYLEDCTTAEIADLTGWSETMVNVQLHRAKKRLRKIWAQAEAGG